MKALCRRPSSCCARRWSWSLPVIVCINKIDRPEARPDEVIDEVLELFMDLDASDEQLDCPFIYASAKSGIAVLDLTDDEKEHAAFI